MNIGDHVRVTRDIPPILSHGEIGKVRERWTKAERELPASWIVDFQNGLHSHFVYEDEMEILELRVGGKK
jgi:hypothetical protein